MTLVSVFVLLIPILINVAFITLLERKILGLSQLRLGPNKVSVFGVTQPFSDAIKLFSNQWEKILSSNSFLFLVSPIVGFSLIMILWTVLPTTPHGGNWSLGALLFIALMSLGIYPLLLAGWSSNSKYALIGGIRGVAQTISYEISLALMFMILISSAGSLSLSLFSEASFIGLSLMPGVFILWFISMLAESNRTPFDFSEGESELVSGFNIEYASTGFALIFMAEYASILALAALTSYLFFSVSLFSMLGALSTSGLVSIWIWVRATYPRYRYDLLMNLAWKAFLPQALGGLAFLSSLMLI